MKRRVGDNSGEVKRKRAATRGGEGATTRCVEGWSSVERRSWSGGRREAVREERRREARATRGGDTRDLGTKGCLGSAVSFSLFFLN